MRRDRLNRLSCRYVFEASSVSTSCCSALIITTQHTNTLERQAEAERFKRAQHLCMGFLDEIATLDSSTTNLREWEDVWAKIIKCVLAKEAKGSQPFSRKTARDWARVEHTEKIKLGRCTVLELRETLRKFGHSGETKDLKDQLAEQCLAHRMDELRKHEDSLAQTWQRECESFVATTLTGESPTDVAAIDEALDAEAGSTTTSTAIFVPLPEASTELFNALIISANATAKLFSEHHDEGADLLLMRARKQNEKNYLNAAGLRRCQGHPIVEACLLWQSLSM